MRALARCLAASGLVLAAAVAGLAYGTGGSLDAVDSALAEGVAASDPSAIKMQGFVRKESSALSQDFITFSKVAKEAEKGEYSVLSEEFLAGHFADMVSQSAFYGLEAFSNLASAGGGDPRVIARLLKANAKYIVKQGKILAKYDAVWGNPLDESKVDLAKAAVYYAQVQKLYEIINRLAAKYTPAD